MKLALAQMKMDADPKKNLEKSIELIEQAADEGADLVLFPEVQLTRFFAQYPHEDRNLFLNDLQAVRAIQKACRDNDIWACPNFYLRTETGDYDMSLLIDSGGNITGEQKMVHIPYMKGFYERDYYDAGRDGFRVFDTEFGRIGIVVCFDRHFFESVHEEALHGADLILIPTANTFGEPTDRFEQEICVEAYQNCVWIAMTNRVGQEGDLEFCGESLVCDWGGNVLVKGSHHEELILQEIDLQEAEEARQYCPFCQETNAYQYQPEG